MDSSRPIILLEEIFEDAHISRAVVVVAQEDHLDKTYTSESDNGSSSSDDDNEFNIAALAPSPYLLPPPPHSHHHPNNPRKRKSNRNLSAVLQSDSQSTETIHWSSLRRENELLKYKCAKLQSSLSSKANKLQSNKSKLHMAAAVHTLKTSLKSVLLLCEKQQTLVKTFSFFRWRDLKTKLDKSKSVLTHVVRKFSESMKTMLQRGFNTWHNETSKNTFLVLRKMAALEKIRFVVDKLEVRHVRARFGLWKRCLNKCHEQHRALLKLHSMLSVSSQLRRAMRTWRLATHKIHLQSAKYFTALHILHYWHKQKQNLNNKLLYSWRKWQLVDRRSLQSEVLNHSLEKELLQVSETSGHEMN